MADRGFNRFFGLPLEVVAALEVRHVRVRVSPLPALERAYLVTQQLKPQCLGRLLRDLRLHLEDTSDVNVVVFRPEVILRCSIDQLYRDARPVRFLAHASLENRTDAKLSRDCRDRLRCPVIPRHGGARHHAEILDPGEAGDEFLRHPVREVCVLRMRAVADEGQHRNPPRIERLLDSG